MAEKAARLKGLVWAPFSFIAGVLLTLVANQWFVPLLPGPKPEVVVSGLQVVTANFAGCTMYSIALSTDEAVDSVYVKIAFPQNIKGMKVGRPGEAVFGQSQQMSMQVWELGRNSAGECDVIQSAVNIDEGVSATAVSNVLTIRTSQLAAKEGVMGIVAVSTNDRAMKTGDPIFRGDYQYVRWGLTVRRKLIFRYQGVQDAR